jgi:hypothetical protein
MVIPAPTGSDLAALELGGTPSAAYFAALAAPGAQVFPLPDSAPKAVFGTIAAFLPAGIVVAVASPLDSTQAASFPYAAGAVAVAETRIDALVDGTTLDLVPGGYVTLRAGDPIIVAGSGPAKAFHADGVIGHFSAPTQSQTIASNQAPRHSDRALATRHREDTYSNQTSFVITGKAAFPGASLTPMVGSIPVENCFVLTGSITGGMGLGESATYPLELADTSTSLANPVPIPESSLQPLPVALINATSGTPPSYIATYGLGITVGFTIQFFGACASFATQLYPAGSLQIGQALVLTSNDPLPGPGQTVHFTVQRCPFIPLPFSSNWLLNLPSSPSLSLCDDVALQGAPLQALATLTNAEVTGASSVTNDVSSFPWYSDMPGGDPMLTYVPLAADDGSSQANTLTLQGMNYYGHLTETQTLAFNAPWYNTPFMVTFPTTPAITVFQDQLPPFNPIIGISDPATVDLTLHPASGVIPVTGR